MFTGIIECLGVISNIEKSGSNVVLTIESNISHELKVDQSVAHNGICLTVTYCDQHKHQVVAIDETIQKTNLGYWNLGDSINLERCLKSDGRFDGHIVQGHVDQIATCKSVESKDGSYIFSFDYDENVGNVTVEKGSICVNGTSLTVVDSKPGKFSVAIIPYTYENTIFKEIKEGTIVNLEFDVIGKYVARMLKGYQ